MKLAWRGAGLELIEPHRPEYVLGTWLRSYAEQFPKSARMDALFTTQRTIAMALLPCVRIAVAPNAPHTIAAWVCGEPGVLHYVFVGAGELRRKGLASALIASVCGATGVSTHPKPKLRDMDLSGAFARFPFDRDALPRAFQARLAA